MINKLNWRNRLYLTMFVFFAAFVALDMMRMYGWGYSIIDIGNFRHFIHNTLNGDWWKTTINYPYLPDTNRLGIHFSILSVVFALPFYAIAPIPETLVILHVGIMTSAALPIYLTCKYITKSDRQAYFWALAFLFNPITIYSTYFSYQDHSLSVPLLAWAMYAIITYRFKLLIICCLLLSIAKEHFGVSIFGLGILWAYQHKEYKRGAALALYGLVVVVTVLFVIMPYFNMYDQHYMLSSNTPQTTYNNRYDWMFRPFPQNIEIGWEILTSVHNIKYYAWLLLPLLLLPLGSIMMMFPAGADIAASMLSSQYVPKSIFFYHSSSVVVILTIAACCTVTKYLSSEKKLFAYLAPTVCAMASVVSLLPILILNMQVFFDENSEIARSDKFNKFKSFLREDMVIHENTDFGPWLTDRRNISSGITDIKRYNTVVFRLSWNAFGTTANPFTSLQIRHLDQLEKNPNWQITYWDDPYLVFEKNKPATMPKSVLHTKINQLKHGSLRLRKIYREVKYDTKVLEY